MQFEIIQAQTENLIEQIRNLKSQFSDSSFRPCPTPSTEMTIGAITVWQSLPVKRRFNTASAKNALETDLSALADKSINTRSLVFFLCTCLNSVLLQVGLSRSPSDPSNVLFPISLSDSFSSLSFQLFVVFSVSRVVPWGGVLPCMGYNGMCGPKWSNGFSDVLVRNWVSILVILVINRVCFLDSSLERGMFILEAATF